MLISDFVKSGGLVKGSSFTFKFSSKLDVSDTDHFGFICSSLKNAFLPMISVYTDGSVKGFGTSNAVGGTATYFSDLGLHISVKVYDMLLSTLTEMQAVMLAFKCIPAFLNVIVFSDSQTFLDACQAKLRLVASNFCNKCWIEHHHISNLVKYKNISVIWLKVKGHSGILGNEHADWLADLATLAGLVLSANVKENFLIADNKSLASSVFDGGLYTFLCKGFMSEDWLAEAKASFVNTKLAMSNLVEFVWSMVVGHRKQIWVPNSKLQAEIEYCKSLCADGSLCNIIQGLFAKVSGGVVYLLGIKKGHMTNFGLSISHLFFAGVAGEVTVNIIV
ncbi:hypothetical protein G9A89_018717 [Geosiphon pyriformis]|nr:hypothetical protein G9A89_018717 [Geosiphon pyriformis]